ncbi:MAG TPA: carboxylating nicotinate-nucleotide diphosphorylase [Actinomycetota bacterium]
MTRGSPPDDLLALVRAALEEDAPQGDLTSEVVLQPGTGCAAELIAKDTGVIAGIRSMEAVFAEVSMQDGTHVAIDVKTPDGSPVSPGDLIARIQGVAATVLRGERPSINLLSHLSGVATLTRAFVDAAEPATILCTRKTTPGLRKLEREAVLAGGGSLHRGSLSDAILIKDNHVQLAGGVGPAVRRAVDHGVPVEVEVETLDQLEEAIAAGADRFLLDNPTPELVGEAIRRLGGHERLEVSGGVTLDNVGSFVDAGARTISVGRLTHSSTALDLSLEITDTIHPEAGDGDG